MQICVMHNLNGIGKYSQQWYMNRPALVINRRFHASLHFFHNLNFKISKQPRTYFTLIMIPKTEIKTVITGCFQNETWFQFDKYQHFYTIPF